MLFLQRKGKNMKETFLVLQKCSLFTGIDENDLDSLLECLKTEIRTYEKGEYILSQGDKITSICVVLSGEVHIIKDDFWGNRTIIAHVEAGELFADAFVCAGIEVMPLSVIAVEKVEVMMIDSSCILTQCPKCCKFHSMLIFNTVKTLAQKNVVLVRKLGHVTQKTTREKILSYLSEQAMRQKSATFTIPFNRQEMADYLSVERTALSNELSKLQKENVLEFNKNCFKFLKK